MVYQEPRPREPMLRVPAIVGWLLAALVGVHLLRLVLPADLDQALLLRFAFIPARYAAGVDGGGPLDLAAPFFGHVFLHVDVFHLGMNGLWLLACGPVVARRYGGFAFLIFFFLCGTAGVAAFMADNWGGTDMVVGASGAISGLMAASIRMIPWFGRYGDAGLPGRPLVPLLSKPVLAFTLFWVISNLLFGLTGIGMGETVHQIAWQAHLGGFACGLLLSSLFEAVLRRR